MKKEKLCYLEKKIESWENVPKFKYIKDNKEVFEFVESPKTCECCKRKTNIIAICLIWAEDDVEVLCPKCIISGKASRKYRGEFNEVSGVKNRKSIKELSKRTPGLNTFNEVIWPSCCDDFCVFQKEMVKKDLKDNTIMSSLEITYQDNDCCEFVPFEDFADFIDSGAGNIMLFKCNTCGKYYVHIDLS